MAVIVNDMAALNLDAKAVVNVAPKLVAMENGCICCTLRADLLEQVASLSRAAEWDYLMIESTGISAPNSRNSQAISAMKMVRFTVTVGLIQLSIDLLGTL